MYIDKYIHVEIDAGIALWLVTNFDLTKHVFADIEGPNAAKDLLLAF